MAKQEKIACCICGTILETICPVCNPELTQQPKAELAMVSPQFIAGAKEGLQTARDYSYDADTALVLGDMHGAQKAIAMLVGQAINCQAVLAAKLTYELSQAETGSGLLTSEPPV